MVCLSWEWLKWPGEVKLQTLLFGYGGYGKWCYSSRMRMGMSSIWCKEALGTKRPKRTTRIDCGTQVAGYALFLQQDGVFMYEEVWEVVESCLRSVLMYGRCVQSFLELLFTGMRDGLSLQGFFKCKQESVSWQSRPVPPSMYAAYLLLRLVTCRFDLALKIWPHASWIWYLT